MPLSKQQALLLLQKWHFNEYYAKSDHESLLIHSFNVFALIDALMQFSTIFSEADKSKMQWAALLHDYGKLRLNWQKKLRGPHKIKLDEKEYEELKILLRKTTPDFAPESANEDSIADILYVIENHHDTDILTSTPTRNQMTQFVSTCDVAVSLDRPLSELIHLLNPLIDTVDYKLFAVELIEHPISPFVAGAFDYIYSETGEIHPILYSPTGTLFICKKNATLPSLDEVNNFFNEQAGIQGEPFNYDNSIHRVYTNSQDYLGLARNVDKFIDMVKNQVSRRLQQYQKRTGWTNSDERVYLYGRICGGTYQALKKLCNIPDNEKANLCLAAGAQFCEGTVRDLENKGYRKTDKPETYEQTLRRILQDLQPYIITTLQRGLSGDDINQGKTGSYDIQDLLVRDTSVFPSLAEKEFDPKEDAKKDYEKYMEKHPLKECPICHNFPQGNVSAAQFPNNSPLGGTVEVFYTKFMRLLKKEVYQEQTRGISPCIWCTLWWNLISGNEKCLFHLCVQPHHVFTRLDWREILMPQIGTPLVELGDSTVSESGVYPHIAMLAIPGRNHGSFIKDLVANENRGENQVLERLYQYGLTSSAVIFNPAKSHHLLTCGSLKIDKDEWNTLRLILRNIIPDRDNHRYTFAVRAIQRHVYAWGRLIYTRIVREEKNMINELGKQTGLSFLSDIWIGGSDKEKVTNAEKLIRGMNETLRRLKDKEDDATLTDAMVAKGLHIAMSTREWKYRKVENQPKEEAALRQIAKKLYDYRNQAWKRTELVRAMVYTLGYFTKAD